MTAQFPYSVPFDLAGLTDRGSELRLEPNQQERQAVANWLGVESLESLVATVRLTRPNAHRVQYEAKVSAHVVQNCVVTLEPVPADIEIAFTRAFTLGTGATAKQRALPRTHLIADFEDDEPEPLDGAVLNLAVPILEEISLALDPYPRASGVSFAAVASAEAAPEPRAASPFAVLSRLKDIPPKTARPARQSRSKTPR